MVTNSSGIKRKKEFFFSSCRRERGTKKNIPSPHEQPTFRDPCSDALLNYRELYGELGLTGFIYDTRPQGYHEKPVADKKRRIVCHLSPASFTPFHPNFQWKVVDFSL